MNADLACELSTAYAEIKRLHMRAYHESLTPSSAEFHWIRGQEALSRSQYWSKAIGPQFYLPSMNASWPEALEQASA